MLLVISAFAEKWDATVEVNKLNIPFAFELGGTQAAPQGWFFNGPERIVSTSGAWDGETLTLRFAQYQSVLRVKKAGNTLEGTYDRGVRGLYPFHATKADAPDISGTWDFPVKNARGELAWRLVVNQNGNSVSGAILRVDGDTGTLSGVYREGVFRMSHFSGARPILVDAKLQSDGSLDLLINGQDHYSALRTKEARERNAAEPADSFHHTTFLNTTDPFPFAFPDLGGRMVRNTDARFQGKVVILAIGGSWCGNCHDEAPFLETLYEKYKARGLEVVALSFEEGEGAKSLEPLRAFNQLYGVTYTTLVAGEPDQLQAKMPAATNLDSFPTTVFLGRDGRVRAVHSGFSSKATGRFYDEQAREIETLVERLLQ